MWLTGRLVPDHKTIADFRLDNSPGIRRSCAQFVELCRRIVAHDVTNQVHDRNRLVPMARAAKDALCRDEMHVLADQGYFSGRQILACHEA